MSHPRTPPLPSRLPHVGTTIFTVMSALAQEHGAVNLGQGFPDFDCDPRLIDAVTAAMREGLNQYPPMAGVPALREAVAAKIEALYGHRYDPGREITITAGATQAILTAILDVLLISDEVYEHMVYDGRAHASVASHAELAARAFVVSSFGKTYHVTGWKVGYVAAPGPLADEFRKVHQFNVFTVNTPVQHGLARFMADPAPYLELGAFYQRKRDLFRAGLAATRFRLLPSEGSYFQCVDYSAISDRTEAEFCRWLTTEVGVAAIPLSAFYAGGFEQRIVRFCFAKKDATLNQALERLARL